MPNSASRRGLPDRTAEIVGQPPQVDATAAILTSLQRHLAEILGILGGVLIVLGVNYAVFLPTASSVWVSRPVLLAAAALLGLSTIVSRHEPGPTVTQLLLLLAGCVGCGALVLPNAFLPSPGHPVNLALYFVAAGFVGLRLWLFAAVILIGSGSWLLSAHASPADLLVAGIELTVASVIGALVRKYRIRDIRRRETARVENEWRRQKLELVLDALRQSEDRFRRLAEAAFEAIAIHDRGSIIDANHAFATLFGYPLEQLRGSPIHGYIRCHDPDDSSSLLRGPSRTFEARGIHSTGYEFPIEIRVKPVPYGNRSARVVAIRDMSERKRTEEELRRAKEAAEKASELKSKWLANVSHELRTPLNSILGFSEMLADEYFGPLNEKQKRYVENILASGRHLLELINDLLDLSKIEAGHMELEISEFDPKTIIQSVVDSLSPLAFQKNIELKTSFRNCPKLIHADQRKLRQVLFNLINNAIKFTDSGGSVIVEATTVAPSPNAYYGDSPFLKVAVHDTGVGIRPEDQERIFNEFEQVSNRHQSNHKGTGLGLPLARKLINLHGGNLWVESKGENQGSTFAFVIPVRPPKDVSTWRAQPLPQRTDASVRAQVRRRISRKPLVLVVDDDPATRELLHDALVASGYDVRTASTPRKALEIAHRESPDVAIVDVFFEGREEGWNILADLKSNPDTRDIPTVIITVGASKKAAYSLGAAAFFPKPLPMQELLQTLSRLTASGENGDATVLLAVRDRSVLNTLLQQLVARGMHVLGATDGRRALKLLQYTKPGVAVLSASLSPISGVKIAQYLGRYREFRHTKVFLLTDDDEKSIPLPHDVLAVTEIVGPKEIPALAEKIAGSFEKKATIVDREN